MKLKNIKKLVLAIIIAPLIYLAVSAVVHISQLSEVGELNELKKFFYGENIHHNKTVQKSYSFPFSLYEYGSYIEKGYTFYEYGIFIFKRRSNSFNFLENVQIEKSKQGASSNKPYYGSDIKYLFDKKRSTDIHKMKISIEGYDETFVKELTQDFIYLSFPIEKNFAIQFNNDKVVDFHARKGQSKGEEYNELFIKKDGEYLYFFYAKPLKPIENQEKEILRKLVKF